MSDNLENYRNRQQTYIKHQFLTRYLEAAAYKILQGLPRKTFNFVDGFAGPWGHSDNNDCSDTSFFQAIQTLRDVRDSLENRVPDLRIRFCFCEKDSDAVVQLQNAIAQLQNESASSIEIETKVITGLFEKNLDKIEDFCNGGFTFTFIDPTGWNIDSQQILDFLKRQQGEFLFNFMEEHINRHAGWAGVADSVGRFLADPKWKDDFDELPSEWSNGRRVLFLLRNRIKNSRAARYVPDFPIPKPREAEFSRPYMARNEPIKMRLLLGTNSVKGLDVFRDIQEKVEEDAIKMREQMSSINSLFDTETIIEMDKKRAGIGCATYQALANERIRQKLTEARTLRFDRIAVDILEHVPIRRKQIKDLVKRMKIDGILKFELSPGARIPRDDTQISLA